MSMSAKTQDLLELLDELKKDIFNAAMSPDDASWWIAAVSDGEKVAALLQEWQDSPEFSEDLDDC
jgi:hypothetical protein